MKIETDKHDKFELLCPWLCHLKLALQCLGGRAVHQELEVRRRLT